MGFLVLVKGFCILVCFFTFCYLSVYSQNGGRNGATVEGFVFIDGNSAIGRIDSDFICATLDWWPPEKCDYGTCSWDHASLLNLVYLHTCSYILLKLHLFSVCCFFKGNYYL